MNKIHFTITFLLILFCSKHHDAIHLTYCGNNIDTVIQLDTFRLPYTPGKPELYEPCFKDSMGDTIFISWNIPVKDDILLELLDQNYNVIQIYINGMPFSRAGSIAFPNKRDNQIYGFRMIFGSYDNTIWFYQN
jgi:hypothetical protein